jgi:hypothetical protein
MAKTKTNGEPVKVTGKRLMVHLSNRAAATLAQIKNETGSKRFSDVLNRGLELYGWLRAQEANGNQIVSRKPDGSWEVLKLLD